MRYLSIDVETTGLDFDLCQVLEVAAVLDDLSDPKPISELPRFVAAIQHSHLCISAVALRMNKQLVEDWANGTSLVPAAEVVAGIRQLWDSDETILAAGKNFASFDRRFLEKWDMYFHHRTLDPAMLFIRKGDVVPPDTRTCCERAGIPYSGSHRALDDALNVVRLVRTGLNIPYTETADA